MTPILKIKGRRISVNARAWFIEVILGKILCVTQHIPKKGIRISVHANTHGLPIQRVLGKILCVTQILKIRGRRRSVNTLGHGCGGGFRKNLVRDTQVLKIKDRRMPVNAKG